MHSQSTQKYAILLRRYLPWLIGLSAMVFIVLRIDRQRQQDWWLALMDSFSRPASWPWLLTAFFLMPLNWWLESEKWRRLLHPVYTVSRRKAFAAVCSGLTVSFFTPNRIGEYVGRVLFVPQEKRGEAALATVAGSYAQLMVTLLVGLLGLWKYLPTVEGLPVLLTWSVMTVAGVMLGILLLAYFRMRRWATALQRLPWIGTWISHHNVLVTYDTVFLMRLFLLSGVRYAVFMIQYLLLLRFFGISCGWLDGVIAVSVIYLIMALIPTVALTELGVRGSVAVVIFSTYTALATDVVFASSALWMMNLAVPSLMGACFMAIGSGRIGKELS